MKNKTRINITLICSLLIFAVAIFRILTESLSSTPLVVAYILAITGLIGVVSNGVMLKKFRTN
ncbi:hypothetical protein QNH39_02005 [Neobacillus novalis]|uniref:Uncharacterized protein n=1 Tax=Neobacillus novalis TaxID=220687 RepID=A0AA95MMC4_9BACI|nr:hypothetical protein [Neobacillus novalis]WHY86677.1 hypothetical protein QNH39_02005 [Neobacillus novalis]